MNAETIELRIRSDLLNFARACAGNESVDAVIESALELLQERVLDLQMRDDSEREH